MEGLWCVLLPRRRPGWCELRCLWAELAAQVQAVSDHGRVGSVVAGVLTIYGGEEGVCFRGENPVWLGQANGGDACGHRHLPKVSIVVTHFPFVVLQMKI